MKPNPIVALVAADLARVGPPRPARPRRLRRRTLVVAVALFALLAGASRAAAAVTAKFSDSTDTVLVNMTATGDVARVWREGDAIRVNGPVTGAPTVTGADVVVFDDNPDLDSTVIVDLRGGPFSPGQGWEAMTPEIEFTQQLDTGFDWLRVLVADTGGGLAVGTGGLNLDPEEGTPADVEFQSLADLETISLEGGAGGDTITGAGGPGVVGGPAAYALAISGGGGEDVLTGGAGADRIDARDQTVDQIVCGGGADWVRADDEDVVAADCETVLTPSSEPPPPPPPPHPGGSAPPPPHATPALRVGKPRVRRGRATLTVTCLGAACRGRIVMKAGRKLLAKGRYRAAAGTTVKAKLKLTRRGKALLKRRKLRAKVRVTVAGGTPATRTVRLRRT